MAKKNIGQAGFLERFVHLANFSFSGQSIASKALRFLAGTLAAIPQIGQPKIRVWYKEIEFQMPIDYSS
tara:strand:- start:2555 stop:2761 length:207 start_codon:yes stop_codon:yes gene_type:complete